MPLEPQNYAVNSIAMEWPLCPVVFLKDRSKSLFNSHNGVRVTLFPRRTGTSISEFSTNGGMLPKPIQSSKLGSPVSLLRKATFTALGLIPASVLIQYNTSFLSFKFQGATSLGSSLH